MNKLASHAMILALCAFSCSTAVLARELWIGGVVPWKDRNSPELADGALMFQEDSPWKTVLAHTNVIMLGPGNIMHLEDQKLRQTFDYLKRHNLSLAVEIGILTCNDNDPWRCEAYHSPGLLESMMGKIQRNGGDLRYVRMDGPLHFGHQHNPKSQHYFPIDEIARQVASNVKIIKGYFPNAQFGDVEGVGNSRSDIQEIAQFADSFQSATGAPLAFMHADVSWSKLAMMNLVPLSREMRSRRIPFSPIYNGVGSTDEEWADSVIENFVETESMLHVHADAPAFMTWVDFPTRMLPENKSATLTNIVFRYLQPETTLRIQRSNSDLTGTLADSKGRGVPNAKLTLHALDYRGLLNPTAHRLSGTVPGNAQSAHVVLRINCENNFIDKNSPGGAFNLGVIKYSDSGTRVTIQPGLGDKRNRNPNLLSMRILPGQTFAPTLKTIPVTAGSHFDLDTAISGSLQSDGAGAVGVIFVDRQGKGIGRQMIKIEPSDITLGELNTDNQGNFLYRIPTQLVDAKVRIKAYFAGNQNLRGAAAMSE